MPSYLRRGGVVIVDEREREGGACAHEARQALFTGSQQRPVLLQGGLREGGRDGEAGGGRVGYAPMRRGRPFSREPSRDQSSSRAALEGCRGSGYERERRGRGAHHPAVQTVVCPQPHRFKHSVPRDIWNR